MQFLYRLPQILKPYAKPANLVELISCLLILLWVYASISKLIDNDRSQREMINQVFPNRIAVILAWAIPFIELLAACLLISLRTRLLGLYASVILLVSFTVYIGLVMTHVFGRIPCSCGGIISKMSWGQHLVFNLAFLALAFSGVFYHHRERRAMEKD